MGQERVDSVNQIIDQLIEGGHTEAAALAEWKDGVNESWADLLELIDTRAQLLQASYDLLKYVSLIEIASICDANAICSLITSYCHCHSYVEGSI